MATKKGPTRHTVTLDAATFELARERFAALQEAVGFEVSWGAFLGGLVKAALRQQSKATPSRGV